MGCAGSSNANDNGKKTEEKKDNNTTTKKEDQKPKEDPKDKPKDDKPTPKDDKPETKYTEQKQDPETLSGKVKFICDVGAIIHAVEDKGVAQSVLVVSAPTQGPTGLCLACQDQKTHILYALRASDAELEKIKSEQQISHNWTAFFKSIASETIKGKVKVKMGATVTVEFDVTSAKDKTVQVLKLDLPKAENTQRFVTLVEPMARMVQRRRQNSDDREKEAKCSTLQSKLHMNDVTLSKYKATIDRIKPNIVPLREKSASYAKSSAELSMKIGRVERKIKRHKRGVVRNSLDAMYEQGGARPFVHLPQADDHEPKVFDWNAKENGAMADYVAAVFPCDDGALAEIAKSPSDPRLQELYKNCSEKELDLLMNCFVKLDDWDYNVFQVNEATGGHALFYTTYALLHKLDLVSFMKVDDRTLRNFLGAVEAGYHPNPYHNATHAADVAQINYFILHVAGLRDKCGLSKEELLAGVLAGAIHDYDHPGFNNNFHSKTNAYLSTLYNDRSILENHHVSCIYEILRNDGFNIFANLEEEQRRLIRDTLVEMILATDMSQHTRYFQSFRRRLGDAPNWAETKDDIKLALSMSVKMADVSNCGRPRHLYLEWAKNIATEFYQQGDAEAQLCLPISPFMDRNKEKDGDFAKGQVTFMNVVIMGMFEKMAEFLPKLEPTVRLCQENREYWQNQAHMAE